MLGTGKGSEELSKIATVHPFQIQMPLILSQTGPVTITPEGAGWHCRMGEIDLIASDGTYLCFVEVKLRKTSNFSMSQSKSSAPSTERKAAVFPAFQASSACWALKVLPQKSLR